MTWTRLTPRHGAFSRIHRRTRMQATSSILLFVLSAQPKTRIGSSTRNKGSQARNNVEL
jgi:hypothetical protein